MVRFDFIRDNEIWVILAIFVKKKLKLVGPDLCPPPVLSRLSSIMTTEYDVALYSADANYMCAGPIRK